MIHVTQRMKASVNSLLFTGAFFVSVGIALYHIVSLHFIARKHERGPVLDRTLGFWLLLNAACLLALAILVFFIVRMGLFLSLIPFPITLSSALLVQLVAGLAIALAWKNIKLGNKLRARGAEEIIAESGTPPVLYLRSFAFDELKADYGIGSFEENLSKTIDPVGPMIAIGRPGEKFVSLGASRVYVSDDEWKGKILEYIDKSQAVVWVYGDTEGLKWEISKLVKLVNPEKLIICFPFWDLSEAKRAQLWERFLEEVGPFFPKKFPLQAGPALFAHFAKDWTPILAGIPSSWIVRTKTLDYKMFLARNSLMRVFAEKGLHYTLKSDLSIHMAYLGKSIAVLLGVLFLIFILFLISVVKMLDLAQ